MSNPTTDTLKNRIYHATTRTEIADLYDQLASAYQDSARFVTDDQDHFVHLARTIASAYRGKSDDELGRGLVRELADTEDLRPGRDAMDDLCARARSIYTPRAVGGTLNILMGVRQTPASS